MEAPKRVVGHPAWVAVVILVAIGLSMPSLFNGYFVDDAFHRWQIAGFPGHASVAISQWDIFTFANGDPERAQRLMDIGIFPWWSPGEFKLSFWRPLTAATLRIDYTVFNTRPWAAHLHSILWYAALVAAATVMFRRLIRPEWVAGLAAIAYAIDDTHALPVGWLANRSAVLAGLFGILTLLLHDRWRRMGLRFGAWLAPFALALSLLSAEAGVAICAYLFSYCLFMDRGVWPRRLLSLIPYAAVVLVWRVVYSHLGYGVNGSSLYIDPLRDPLRFLEALLIRGPAYLMRQWLPIPIDALAFLPSSMRYAAAAFAVLCLLAIGRLLTPILKTRPRARFWALGMILAVVPICATFPMDRNLIFVGMGGAALLAELLARPSGTAGGHIESSTQARSQRRRGILSRAITGVPSRSLPARAFIVFLILVHLVLAPIAFPIRAATPLLLNTLLAPLFVYITAEEVPGNTLVALQAPDPYSLGQITLIRATSGLDYPERIRRLATSLVPLEVTRVDAQSLDIRALEHSLDWFDGLMLRVPEDPMIPGQHLSFVGFQVEVLEADLGGHPTRARFRFDVPLEHPSLTWIRYFPEGWRGWQPPPVGRSVRIEPAIPALSSPWDESPTPPPW